MEATLPFGARKIFLTWSGDETYFGPKSDWSTARSTCGAKEKSERGCAPDARPQPRRASQSSHLLRIRSKIRAQRDPAADAARYLNGQGHLRLFC